MRKQISILALLLSSGLVLGCGYFKPQPAVATPTTGPSRCELMSMIEDAEDADSQILVREGRGGYIYTYADDLGSKLSPWGDFKVSRGGVGDSKFALRMVGKTAAGPGDVYVGMGFAFAQAEGATYDASKYKGITFVARKGHADAVSAVRISLPDANTDPVGGICAECHNNFGTTVRLTEDWTQYVVSFDDLRQATGWGDPRPEKVEVTALVGLQVQVALPNQNVDVWIDDIRFYGACGEQF
ncbi:MAG: hypothetical protein M0R76_08770 [Proteobacteria bacterium]|nr:hypothetical protein [Pseudomonadota bacterium]